MVWYTIPNSKPVSDTYSYVNMGTSSLSLISNLKIIIPVVFTSQSCQTQTTCYFCVYVYITHIHIDTYTFHFVMTPVQLKSIEILLTDSH